MASIKQIQILLSFGFDKFYAESLPNFHAQKLIQQLYHIRKTYLHGDRALTKLSVENLKYTRNGEDWSGTHSNEDIAKIVSDCAGEPTEDSDDLR